MSHSCPLSEYSPSLPYSSPSPPIRLHRLAPPPPPTSAFDSNAGPWSAAVPAEIPGPNRPQYAARPPRSLPAGPGSGPAPFYSPTRWPSQLYTRKCPAVSARPADASRPSSRRCGCRCPGKSASSPPFFPGPTRRRVKSAGLSFSFRARVWPGAIPPREFCRHWSERSRRDCRRPGHAADWDIPLAMEIPWRSQCVDKLVEFPAEDPSPKRSNLRILKIQRLNAWLIDWLIDWLPD